MFYLLKAVPLHSSSYNWLSCTLGPFTKSISCTMLRCAVHLTSDMKNNLPSLTESHLLHQATQRERGSEGGSGEEAETPAPGVAVDVALQRLPERRRACQALHEGRTHCANGKGWKLGGRWTLYGRNENWHFLPDSLSLCAGWSLWAPGPGEGCGGAAETLPPASQTVSSYICSSFGGNRKRTIV